jgi:nucleotide-binding universal stress UspA family protein
MSTVFNKILVPLDGSELAERALEPALTLAHHVEGEVTLLRVPLADQIFIPDAAVLAGYGVMWPDQALEESRKASRAYLGQLQHTRATPRVTLHTQLREGDVAEAILDTAAQTSADLIALSSHGYSGLRRWMLGSVAERVLHQAICPVLVVRSPKPVQHILIPLDGSALAEKILPAALETALGLKSQITLLRAIPAVPPADVDHLEQIEPGLGKRLEEDLHDEAQRYLQEVAEAHHQPSLTLNTAVVHEPAAEAILQYADAHQTDLIAMSTHGRTGLQRWVYGSVTEKVLHGASCCSMLVVRPKQHQVAMASVQHRTRKL